MAAGSAGSEDETAPVLEARGLTMSFGTVEVLSDVSLSFNAGEVHAVIGENGAGKSTLMRLLSGHLAPTRGAVAIAGEPVRFTGPVDAERRGIVLVHQEILLAPDLSVARNIFMGREIRRGALVDDRTMDRRAAEAVRALGAALDPKRPVARLSIAQRQIVQIARALDTPHRIVIFDEPTASLTPVESEALLGIIRTLKARGVAVLYISHRLADVVAIADRVTVLRDGRVVAQRLAGELDAVGMAHLMVGREMARLYPERSPVPQGPIALEARNVSVPGFATDASLAVRRGEILGMAGLVGAGRTELFEGIAGLRPMTGEVLVGGAPARFRGVRDSRRRPDHAGGRALPARHGGDRHGTDGRQLLRPGAGAGPLHPRCHARHQGERRAVLLPGLPLLTAAPHRSRRPMLPMMVRCAESQPPANEPRRGRSRDDADHRGRFEPIVDGPVVLGRRTRTGLRPPVHGGLATVRETTLSIAHPYGTTRRRRNLSLYRPFSRLDPTGPYS